MPKKIALCSSLLLVPSSLFAGVASPSPVPEPGTLLLLAGGIGAAILLERKRRKKN